MFQHDAHSDSPACDSRPSAIGRVGVGFLLLLLVPSVAWAGDDAIGPTWAWIGATGANTLIGIGAGWVASQARRRQDTAEAILDKRFQRTHDKLSEKGDKSTQDELRAELREFRQRQERQERQIGGLQQELRHQMELSNTKLDSLAEQLANIVKLLEGPR